MSTTLRFDDHPGFHREVLVGAVGAAAIGAGWAAMSSSPWAALQGAAVGLAVGLGALRTTRSWYVGLGLVAVAAGLLAVHLGAGLWGLAAMTAALAALHVPVRRIPWAAGAGLALGYSGGWAAARIGAASEIASLPAF